MNIKTIKLENFRSYKDEVIIEMSDLNVFVGKNDIGKSTILEALDIFFNEGKGIIKIDKEDVNKEARKEKKLETKITVIFTDLPEEIVIDTSNSTSLSREFLLNSDENLEIIKKFSNAGKEKVFIKANHPTNKKCSDLLLKKIKDLTKILKNDKIKCEDSRKSAEVRKSIWDFYSGDLQLNEIEIDVTKEDAKAIWEQVKKYLPMYSLFQSDRKNGDGDSEVQNPMKLAVQEILKNDELTEKLNSVAEEVEKKLKEVVGNTLNKLNEMNPDVASSLNPIIPTANELKWADVFKNVSITGDENIPVNKRGSGVKRLILLNFFRAEAERRQKEKSVPNIIYAIEEPETSQHPSHQRKLIEAFIELSKTENTQIIMTTHSPSIVKLLDFSHIKIINHTDKKEIIDIEKKDLPFPSLNEANYLAFGEADEEYHNELYGFIESKNELQDYKRGKIEIKYIQIGRNKTEVEKTIIKSEYIRHQIHHPENTLNSRFTNNELQNSIKDMRKFISDKSI